MAFQSKSNAPILDKARALGKKQAVLASIHSRIGIEHLDDKQMILI